MGTALDAVNKLTAVADKLLHETERLRRDVEKLNARVQPIEGQGDFPAGSRDEPPPTPKIKWPVVEALNMIDRARRSVMNCEYDLSAIRARMDNIAGDALSRDEMKPWIKEK
jgi:hypothetical protein